MMMDVKCDLCGWRVGAADERSAQLAIGRHVQTVHIGPGRAVMDAINEDPVSFCAALADQILDHMVQTDAAQDAATQLRWLNSITVQDAGLLHALKILPT